MKYYYVKLSRMRVSGIMMEPFEEEGRLFSSKKMAEIWLKANGFIYGQRSFFNYPTGGKEWFHKDDIYCEYVNVDIIKMNVDDPEDSKFKNLKEISREWRAEFFDE